MKRLRTQDRVGAGRFAAASQLSKLARVRVGALVNSSGNVRRLPKRRRRTLWPLPTSFGPRPGQTPGLKDETRVRMRHQAGFRNVRLGYRGVLQRAISFPDPVVRYFLVAQLRAECRRDAPQPMAFARLSDALQALKMVRPVVSKREEFVAPHFTALVRAAYGATGELFTRIHAGRRDPMHREIAPLHQLHPFVRMLLNPRLRNARQVVEHVLEAQIRRVERGRAAEQYQAGVYRRLRRELLALHFDGGDEAAAPGKPQDWKRAAAAEEEEGRMQALVGEDEVMGEEARLDAEGVAELTDFDPEAEAEALAAAEPVAGQAEEARAAEARGCGESESGNVLEQAEAWLARETAWVRRHARRFDWKLKSEEVERKHAAAPAAATVSSTRGISGIAATTPGTDSGSGRAEARVERAHFFLDLPPHTPAGELLALIAEPVCPGQAQRRAFCRSLYRRMVRLVEREFPDPVVRGTLSVLIRRSFRSYLSRFDHMLRNSDTGPHAGPASKGGFSDRATVTGNKRPRFRPEPSLLPYVVGKHALYHVPLMRTYPCKPYDPLGYRTLYKALRSCLRRHDCICMRDMHLARLCGWEEGQDYPARLMAAEDRREHGWSLETDLPTKNMGRVAKPQRVWKVPPADQMRDFKSVWGRAAAAKLRLLEERWRADPESVRPEVLRTAQYWARNSGRLSGRNVPFHTDAYRKGQFLNRYRPRAFFDGTIVNAGLLKAPPVKVVCNVRHWKKYFFGQEEPIDYALEQFQVLYRARQNPSFFRFLIDTCYGFCSDGERRRAEWRQEFQASPAGTAKKMRAYGMTAALEQLVLSNGDYVQVIHDHGIADIVAHLSQEERARYNQIFVPRGVAFPPPSAPE